MDTRHSQHAGWPDMMKTWIGPSWTGSGSGFIDEFATPKQVSISSAMVVRLCERKVALTQHRALGAPVVVGGEPTRRRQGERRRRVWRRMPHRAGPFSCMLGPHRRRSRRGARGCKSHLLPGGASRRGGAL